ncbi:MAG: hypothetical protein F6J87_25850 [Spirulina sp. SIO3F2]|nr:hypothetical protein [Spirulina sp. SIO3F2]
MAKLAPDYNLPKAMRIWDNAARLSLPLGLKVWLGFLVSTFVAALFFVMHHAAARWAIAGFILSHIVVYLLSASKTYTLRRGMVSLLHVVCWSPALGVAIWELMNNWQGSINASLYDLWCGVFVMVVAIAFIFDLRDSGAFVYYVLRRR